MTLMRHRRTFGRSSPSERQLPLTQVPPEEEPDGDDGHDDEHERDPGRDASALAAAAAAQEGEQRDHGDKARGKAGQGSPEREREERHASDTEGARGSAPSGPPPKCSW